MDRKDDSEAYALEYLGAKDGERLSPPLDRFLSAALARIDAQAAKDRSFDQRHANEFHGGCPAGIGGLALLIESWLVANPGEQPLWPKDYVEEPGPLVFGGDNRPKWMKRKWV